MSPIMRVALTKGFVMKTTSVSLDFSVRVHSMPTEPTGISKYISISVNFEFCHFLEDVIETRSGIGTDKDDGQSQTNQGSHKHLITVYFF